MRAKTVVVAMLLVSMLLGCCTYAIAAIQPTVSTQIPAAPPHIEDDQAIALNQHAVADDMPTTPDTASIEGGGGQLVASGQRRADRPRSEQAELSSEEMRSYLDAGLSIEDIYKADEAAANFGLDPRQLLEKRKEGTKWDEAVKQASKERTERLVSDLKKTHGSFHTKLVKQGLNNPDDQLMLLAHMELNPDENADELITAYKQQGSEAFKNRVGKRSQVMLDALGLTSEETEGVSDAELSRLAEVADKFGKSLKEIVKEYRSVKAKVGK